MRHYIGGRVKDLLDAEAELVQRVEALQARLNHGSQDHADSFETEAWSGYRPEVSVVITSFNYGDVITDAIGSVLSSPGVAAELVIVDDHSRDDSVRIIRDQMEAAPWFPIKLLAKAANSGLSIARNVGIAEARAERFFILDADNVVYPRSLRKLSAALDRSPDAAFSYGIIDTDGLYELKSHLSWNVRRMTEANYIDAMAMIRRTAWDQVGGYDPMLRGWEDYEFWLHLAAEDLRGEFVPEFIGHYRVHSESMLQTVNLDTAPLMDLFRDRYPHLPWNTELVRHE